MVIEKEKAIVLLSGGLDSATALGVAIENDYDCYPLCFDYGQNNSRELIAASAVARHYIKRKESVKSLKVIRIEGLDFRSALTGSSDLPVNREEEEMESEIPLTYVPARNSIFLAIAVAFAEAIEASQVVTGFNIVDAEGYPYPDSRPVYLDAMQKAMELGTKRGVEGNPITLSAPLIGMTKAEIAELSLKLLVPVQYTWSCYSHAGRPCQVCDACKIRALAFERIGKQDPAQAR